MNSYHAHRDVHRETNFDLQGLRGIAIILVVLAHTNILWFEGGFVGVDIFFVLSGYLITSALLVELDENNKIRFSRFYAKRAKRLLPALLAMLIGTALLATALLSKVEVREQLGSLTYAATWSSNIYFAFSSFDYFNELSHKDLFLHTWSLSVEEQFYLFWPLLLLLFFKLSTSRRGLYIGLCVLAALSFSFSVFASYQEPMQGFYQMPARIWQFCIGGMIALGWLKATALSHSRLILWLGLCCVIISAAVLDSRTTYPGFWAILPSLGTGLILRGALAQGSTWLSHSSLVWFGDRSYSLYLWHWPIFTIGFSLGALEATSLLFLSLCSIVSSMISYRLIEIPFWKGRYSRSAPRTILLASLLSIVAVCAVVQSYLVRLPSLQSNADITNRWRADIPQIYRDNCDSWFHSTEIVPCVYGTPGASKTAVLVGDSIGAQWFSLVHELHSTDDWQLIVYTKSSCPMVDESYFYERIGRVFDVCAQWRSKLLSILASSDIERLFIGSASTYPFTGQEWLDGTKRLLNPLAESVGTIYIIPGTPVLKLDGPSCIERNILPDGKVDRSACFAPTQDLLASKVKSILDTVSSQYDNVHLLDMNPYVCPEGNCNAISSEGVVVYRDQRHLADNFVRSLVPVAKKLIDLEKDVLDR